MFESLCACTSARKPDQYALLEINSDEDAVSKIKEDIENKGNIMTGLASFFRKVILPTKISEEGLFNKEMLKKISERNHTSAP